MRNVLLTIILLFLLPACSFSTPLTLASSPERVFIESKPVSQGEEAEVVLKLDSAPKGLAGYEMVITLENGEVADIIRVEFPEWAKLSDSAIENDTARLKAVDLDDKVKPGATNVELASILFGNTKPGESSIKISVIRMDDDEGNPIAPTIELGKLVVQEGATSAELKELKASYESLKAAYDELKSSYESLKDEYGSLKANYSSLKASCEKLLLDYNKLKAEYNSLKSRYVIPPELTYLFITTTLIFIATTIYFASKRRA